MDNSVSIQVFRILKLLLLVLLWVWIKCNQILTMVNEQTVHSVCSVYVDRSTSRMYIGSGVSVRKSNIL